MHQKLPTGLVITALLLASTQSFAASIVIRQSWLSSGFAVNGRTADTTSVVNASDISGTGIEDALLTYFGMAVYMHGIGQNFNTANLPAEPSFDKEGNVFARFNNGSFVGLGNVNLGGNPSVGLINGGPPYQSAGGFLVGGGAQGPELIWLFPISGQETFLLDPLGTTVTFPLNVPIPAALLLLLSACGVLLGAASRPNGRDSLRLRGWLSH